MTKAEIKKKLGWDRIILNEDVEVCVGGKWYVAWLVSPGEADSWHIVCDHRRWQDVYFSEVTDVRPLRDLHIAPQKNGDKYVCGKCGYNLGDSVGGKGGYNICPDCKCKINWSGKQKEAFGEVEK